MDEQEELHDSRRREAQARRDLESDGCPPCYPPDVDVSELRDPPTECRATVDYWLSFPWTGGNLLCAQLIEWRKFRASQQRARRRFKDFEQELRQRRQRHGLDGPPALAVELEQQSTLQRWIEFQNHALVRLEGMERKRDGLKKELTEPHTADDMDAYKYMLETSEQDIKRHMVLLHWIEQKRQAMNSGDDARASGNGHKPIVRRASARACRKREATLSPVLDNQARISKPSGLLTRKTRHQMAKPETATSTQSSDIILPEATSQRKRRLPIAKGSNQIGSAKDNSALSQLGSQKRTKPQPRSTGRAPMNRAGTVTRSGRISKAPDRWGLG